MGLLNRRQKINRIRPTIGITGPDRGGGAAWFFTALSVMLAGGKPVRITPQKPRTADGLQAIIIGGGADVDPSIYEQENVLDLYLKSTLQQSNKGLFGRIGRFVGKVYYLLIFFFRKMLSRNRKLSFSLDKARDHLELQLLDQAVKKNLPVMGICRGAQLINVYFRGTLFKSLSTFYTEVPNPSSIFPVKTVNILPGSKLAKVLHAQKLYVNALHNQAVNQPGEGIIIAAREENNVVQAIEHSGCDYLIGVQWHPEYLVHKKAHRKLFCELVKQAREVKQQIEGSDLQKAIRNPEMQVQKELVKQS